MDNGTLLASIGSQGALLAVLAGLGYVYFTPGLEKSVFQLEIDDLVNEVLDDIAIVVPNLDQNLAHAESFIPAIRQLAQVYFQDETRKIEEENQEKRNKVLRMILILGVAVVVGMILLKNSINFEQLLPDVIFGTIAMGIAYVIFLMYSVKQYKPISSNEIKSMIIEKLLHSK